MAHNADTRMGEAAHGHGGAAHVDHKVPYFGIFGLLVALTILTVAVAFLPGIHNEIVKVLIAIAIAGTKATFVAMYFMHLKFEGKLIYMIFFIPLIFVVIVIFALMPDIVMPALHNQMLGRPQPY